MYNVLSAESAEEKDLLLAMMIVIVSRVCHDGGSRCTLHKNKYIQVNMNIYNNQVNSNTNY